MNAMVLLIVAVVILVAGYVLYGGWLAKQWGVDPNRPTPAHELEDGVDYVPAPPYVVLGHHFSSIAGAGPINGPIQAAVFGWVPVVLWVLIGGIFFGAVHDFGSLFASIRHKGKTLASVVAENIDGSAKRLFCIFAYLVLVLVVAAFASIVANTFASTAAKPSVANEQTASISVLFVLAAIIWGLATRGRKLPAVLNIGLAIVVIVVVVTIGFNFHPLQLGYTEWMIILGIYILIASVAPVWILLQPRDYLSSYLLYGMIILAVVGIIGAGIAGAASDLQIPAFTGFFASTAAVDPTTGQAIMKDGVAVVNKAAQGGFLFPALFVTIACGAVSGFHSLVSSGTSSKTIRNEKDMLFVGYGAMVLETLLGVLSLIIVGAVAVNGNVPDGLTPFQIFSAGVAGFLESFGVPNSAANVFMTMCVSALALTSLDSVARIGRMSFQELFAYEGEGEAPSWQKLFTNKYFATVVTLALGYVLCLGGYQNVWALFGAANQMLAALVLISIAVFLKATGRKHAMLYFPMTVMLLVTFTAIILNVVGNVKAFAAGTGTFLVNGMQLIVACFLIVLGVLVAVTCIRKLVSTVAGKAEA